MFFTGGTGLLHGRGRRATLVEANGFTVGVLEVGRREKQSCGKGCALSSVGAKRLGTFIFTFPSGNVRRCVVGENMVYYRSGI